MRLLLGVLLTVVLGEDQPGLGARLRQAGPYRHHTTFTFPVTSKKNPSYLTRGDGHTADTYDLLLRELYKNHNFDIDYHSSDDYNMPATDYIDNDYHQRNNNNGFYQQNKGGFHSRGFLNGMDQRGGTGHRDLGAAQGWGQGQGQHQDVARKAGVLSGAGRQWTHTMRSDSGYGGTAGGKLSIDVYSILALGIYTAFLAYLVYHYITTVDAGGARSLKPAQNDKVLWILEDVARAFERWAAFEFLPQELPEGQEEEVEEGKEEVRGLLDGWL